MSEEETVVDVLKGRKRLSVQRVREIQRARKEGIEQSL
jgi:hypothetical protein